MQFVLDPSSKNREFFAPNCGFSAIGMIHSTSFSSDGVPSTAQELRILSFDDRDDATSIGVEVVCTRSRGPGSGRHLPSKRAAGASDGS
jgi:hypothetical protein